MDEVTVEQGLLTLRGRRAGGTFVIELYGELDMATVPALEGLISHPHAIEAAELVLDLSALHFIDAAGMRAIFAAAVPEERQGLPPVHLLRGPPNIDQLFRLTGLADRLSFLD
jgi:anti-anti-sigma factor